MATRLSRRTIARHTADQLLKGDADVVRQLAAFLIDTRRTRELELIVRDVEDALVGRGVVIASVASARDLTAEAKKAISTFISQTSGASTVHLRPRVDPSLLGGVKIDLPGEELDTTLRRKLTLLKSNKV